MIRTSEKIDILAVALAKFQAQVGPIAKDARNPHLKNRYASLAGIVETIQPLLSECGLVIVQGAEGENGLIGMTTRIAHAESGQWQEATILIPIGEPGPGRNLAQEVGSSLTYLRRYGLLAALGLVIGDEDDDGGQPPRKPAARKAPAGNGRQTRTNKPPPPPPATAEELFPETASPNKEAYWNGLGPTERGCYRSWDNVRGAVGDLERYKSPQAVTGVIRKLFPGFTTNGYPTEATAEHGQRRVSVYRTVKAYAELRDSGMEAERAATLAFQTGRNLEPA